MRIACIERIAESMGRLRRGLQAGGRTGLVVCITSVFLETQCSMVALCERNVESTLVSSIGPHLKYVHYSLQTVSTHLKARSSDALYFTQQYLSSKHSSTPRLLEVLDPDIPPHEHADKGKRQD